MVIYDHLHTLQGEEVIIVGLCQRFYELTSLLALLMELWQIELLESSGLLCALFLKELQVELRCGTPRIRSYYAVIT